MSYFDDNYDFIVNKSYHGHFNYKESNKMKIKIISIIQQLPDVQGNNKTTGKPYTMKHWYCEVFVNGQQAPYEVKSFDTALMLEMGKEYEAEPKTYNGITSYQIVSERKAFSKGGYSRPTYTKHEYNDLFKYALNMTGIDVKALNEDNKCKIFATYFIGAKDSNVKIEAENKQQPHPQQNNTQPVDNGYPEDNSQIPF
jgi:hypothetical protein